MAAPVAPAENPDDGIDTVFAAINWTLRGDFETLYLTGFDGLRGLGNDLANEIVGEDGDDTLGGGAGADTVSGRLGDDFLRGGAGRDTPIGGDGDDVFLFQRAAHSKPGNKADRITDFSIGEDLIDLTDLLPGGIAFLGSGAFTATGQAELRATAAPTCRSPSKA